LNYDTESIWHDFIILLNDFNTDIFWLDLINVIEEIKPQASLAAGKQSFDQI
jgi:hypothetical protein